MEKRRFNAIALRGIAARLTSEIWTDGKSNICFCFILVLSTLNLCTTEGNTLDTLDLCTTEGNRTIENYYYYPIW